MKWIKLVCPRCLAWVEVLEDHGAWCSNDGRHPAVRMKPSG